MKFLILGATGMAGHTVALYLKERGHLVRALTRRPFPWVEEIRGETTDFDFLKKLLEDNEYDAVINCVGILNQDAERNKYQAVLLNASLPHYLAHVTENTKIKVIHMSTDCVFSGLKGGYLENSLRDGENFYDRTKALGELENSKDLTFRNSVVGPDIRPNGIGLFNWFMQQKGPLSGYTTALWTGVTSLTLAKAMEEALKQNLSGIYNLVNNKIISKYTLLSHFNSSFRKGKILINPSENVRLDKSLKNTRTDFAFIVPSYEAMIDEMKEWVLTHKDLYPHYFSCGGF